jgi:poly(3-hydroxybutyrate) depolymerase
MRISYLCAASAAVLAACGSMTATHQAALPQLSTATGSTFSGDCAVLLTKLGNLNKTTITSAVTVPAGIVSGVATGEHCQLIGKMNERVGPVDGATYAIGFEVRAPKNWNGRFFYQANGGLDGSISTAAGGIGGGGPSATALSKGFAVLSSNAGHPAPSPFFGLDPQARLDYGYNAVAQLTPMAKNLVKAVYGKAPDRSYIGGCSNGGRHAMVAASRLADQYDGILVGNPGFNLPQAAVAQIWGAQQYAKVATGTTAVSVVSNGVAATQTFPDIKTAFTTAEMNTVSNAVLSRCDALDGAKDGLVSDIQACQTSFNLVRDVPTCTGARDGSCLSSAQKTVLGDVFKGARNTAGTALYSSFPFDAGINGSDWRGWKFSYPEARDAGAVAFIFTSPPQTQVKTFAGLPFVMNFNMDTDAPKIFATSGIYTESPMSFMTPPNPTNLGTLKNRGAKLIAYHGTSDPVFSFNDTRNWYEGLAATNQGDARNFARLFAVPGMNHCAGGPATDKFDMLDPLVAWVESGTAPDAVVASARGAGAAVVNTGLPANWSATRTRPLCAWPFVSKYKGNGDLESASSFSCQP